MRFAKALWIPVYEYTEAEFELVKIGLEKDEMGWSETVKRPFWCIDSACQVKDDLTKVKFYVFGEPYYTPGTLQEFVNLIDKHSNKAVIL